MKDPDGIWISYNVLMELGNSELTCRNCLTNARVCSGVVFLIATIVLLTWIFNFETLISFSFWQAMHWLTAISFICCSIALYLITYPETRSKQLLKYSLLSIVFLINISAICDRVWPHYGFLSVRILTSACMLLTCVTFLLLDRKITKKVSLFKVPNLIVMLCALFSILGYIFGSDPNGNPLMLQTRMAIHTSFALFLLSLGLFLARPQTGVMKILHENSASGFLLKTTVFPTFLGYILFSYVTNLGQNAGLYDDAYSDALALTATIGISTILMYVGIRILDKLEKKRLDAEFALQDSEKLFRDFAEKITEVFWRTSPDFSKILYISPAVEKIWGLSKDAIYADHNVWLNTIVEEDRARVKNAFLNMIKDDHTSSIVLQYRCKSTDGELKYIYNYGFKRFDEQGNLIALLGVATDITTLEFTKQSMITQQQIAHILGSEQQIQHAIPQILEILCKNLIWSKATFWLVDKAQKKLCLVDTYPIHETENRNEGSELKIGEDLIGQACELKRSQFKLDPAAQFKTTVAIPIVYKHTVLGVISLNNHEKKEIDETILTTLEVIGIEIGEFLNRLRVEENIQQVLAKDSLTGLLSRASFEEQLQHLFEKNPLKFEAIIVISIDKYELINESMGYEAGEEVLKLIGTRLVQQNFSSSDLVARLSNDKFALVPAEATSINEVVNNIYKVIDMFKMPVYIKDKELLLTPSIGVSFYPKDGDNTKEVLMNADLALSDAKQAGGNTFKIFRRRVTTALFSELTIEKEVKQAIKNNEFVLYHQPKLDLKTGEIVGVESLIRWQHPEKGLLSPSAFMPIIEDKALIILLSEWVIQEVCKLVLNHQFNIPIALNLSVHHFKTQYNLVGYLEQMISGFNIDPKAIELEITETVLMNNTTANLSLLAELKRLGFQLTIDDFGTGFSSLSYLRNIAADKVKLDKSFIDGIPENKKNVLIVKAIIALFHTLQVKVVAEGVELPSQLEFLIQENCDEIQGYIVSPPLSLQDITELLKNPPPWIKKVFKKNPVAP